MDKPSTSVEVIIRLRANVLTTWMRVNADKITAPAALGVCAQMVKDELGCDLRASVLLVECWTAEHTTANTVIK